jgi:hypothetical protein
MGGQLAGRLRGAVSPKAADLDRRSGSGLWNQLAQSGVSYLCGLRWRETTSLLCVVVVVNGRFARHPRFLPDTAILPSL